MRYGECVSRRNKERTDILASSRNKGKSLLIFPNDYCVIDIETTGLTPGQDEIIEIAAVRYRNMTKQASFDTFVRPVKRISSFITGLTGITNDMVADAPGISTAIAEFADFIGDDILMGYNVNFDINFLYDSLLSVTSRELSNNFVDVLRFARKALPHLPRRSQTDVAAYYGIETEGAHRADRDCEICNECYRKLMQEKILNITNS